MKHIKNILIILATLLFLGSLAYISRVMPIITVTFCVGTSLAVFLAVILREVMKYKF